MNDIIAGSPVKRLLLLDRNPARPQWLLVAQLLPEDAWPADMDGAGGSSRYRNWEAATAHVRQQAGEHDVRLEPMSFPTLAWRLVTGDGSQA